MKKITFFLFVLTSVILMSCQNSGNISTTGDIDLSGIDPGSYDGTWWNREPYRLVQTNLPETEALMDVKAYIQSIVDANATIVLINCGGIVANYPTKLPFHYKNPFMTGDLMGDLVSGLHEKGIRVIARFDFSKLNETLAVKKPEWLYVSTAGHNVNYNGQVHTCINGGYQQEVAFDILTEALTAYKFDGIFFNMIGYTTSDYSGNQYGFCQCENCKRRFKEFSGGLSIPASARGGNDPAMLAYNNFRNVTSAELFSKISAHIKELRPDIMINNYTDAGSDMIAHESNSEFTRVIEWNYSATENVKRDLGSYKDRSPGNLLIYFQAISYRHVGTSPNLARVWMLENILHGAPLGFVFTGATLVTNEDRIFIPELNHYYGFHKKYDKLFTNVQAVNKVGVITGSRNEYQGIMNILTGDHIMYDLITPAVLGTDRMPRKLADYEALILAEVTGMSDSQVNIIDEYVSNGGKIITTGFTSTSDELGKQLNEIRLKSLGVKPTYGRFPRTPSSYLKIYDSDKQALGQGGFKDFTIMAMFSDFLKCDLEESAKGYMRLLPETRFGPPEKCYYTEEQITDYPGVIVNTYGKGKSVFIPWRIGEQYRAKGHYMHRAVFMSALNNVLNVEPTIHTNASPLIEMTHLANLNGQYEWIGLINHSGQIGGAYLEPVTIHNTDIRFKPQRPVKRMYLLNSGASVPFSQKGDWIECTVPQINDFEMVLCLYE